MSRMCACVRASSLDGDYSACCFHIGKFRIDVWFGK